MSRIGLTSGFNTIPEGEYIFKITGVQYKEEFGKLEVSLVTKEGLKHTERFSFMDGNGGTNERAMNAFSYLAKTALNDFSLTEIDSDDLVGHYFRGTVVYDVRPNKNDPNKNVTFVNVREVKPADGFEGVEEAPKKSGFSLDDLLG